MTPTRLVILGAATVLCLSSAAAAQAPAPPADPPKDWTGSLGAGVSLTEGNNNTVNFSAAFDSVYDPKTGNVAKFTALFLRGNKDGELVVDRTSFGIRDERNVSTRTFAFGQVDFLRDTFKAIDSLVAPTAGFGYKIADSDATKFLVDAGAGGAWERNPGLDSRLYGAITLDEKLALQLTPTTTLKHTASSLHRSNEPADGLYTFSLGLAVKISTRMQLAIDALDTFKNRPPDATTLRNDVALITSITVKY